MADVCHAFKANLEAGQYDNLVSAVAEPWKALSVPVKKQQTFEDCLDSDDEPLRVARKRLCMDDLVKHYHQHGATGTFAASVCDISLEDGQKSRLCYAFPKWNLQNAIKKQGELCGTLKLGLAQSAQDVHRAASSLETGALVWKFQ